MSGDATDFTAKLDRGIADANAGRTKPFTAELLDDHIARSKEREQEMTIEELWKRMEPAGTDR